jgi:hypothetical protein
MWCVAATKAWYQDATSAEGTFDAVTSFNSDGFTVGTTTTQVPLPTSPGPGTPAAQQSPTHKAASLLR